MLWLTFSRISLHGEIGPLRRATLLLSYALPTFLVLPIGSAIAQQVVANNTNQVASGTINTGVLAPTAGYALYALNGGTIQSLSPLTITAGGANAVHALSGGSISLFNGSIVATTGAGHLGLFGAGVGTTITADSTSISTAGNSAVGVEATQGAEVTLNNGSVTTTLSQSDGLFAFLANSKVTANGVTIRTTGAQSHGAEANVAGRIIVNGGSVTTLGVSAEGLYTIDRNATLEATGTAVRTSGSNANGINVLVGRGTLNNVTLATSGDGSAGARVDNASTLSITNGSITTSGNSSYGLMSTAGSTLTANTVTVSTTGTSGVGASAQFGGQLILNGGSVDTTGSSAAGLFSVGLLSASGVAATGTVLTDDPFTPTAGPTGASIRATGVRVTTSGANANGVTVRGASSVVLDGSTVTVQGAGANALFSSAYDAGASSITVGTSTLSSALGAGIRVNGTTLNTTLTSSSLSGGGSLLQVVGNGVLNLTADRLTLTGLAFTEAGSTSTVNLIDTRWNMTGTSNLTTLTNDPSLINFSAPAADPSLLSSYMTLSVVNYIGDGGQIALNTYLAGDGSPSDRLVINGGSAIGTTGLIVKGTGGGGAVTTGDGILVVDAISGGITNAGAFNLAVPVVAGPYEYSLYRGSAGGGEPSDWFLRSELIPVPPVPPVPVPPIPEYRREVSLDAAIPPMAALYGRQMIDSLHKRQGDRRLMPGIVDIGQDSLAWGRLIGVTGTHGGDPLGIYAGSAPSFDYTLAGLQAGIDLYQGFDANGSTTAGMYVGVGSVWGEVDHALPNRTIHAGTTSMKAFSLGGYWTRYWDNAAYVDAVIQASFYDFTTDSHRLLPAARANGLGLAASLEGGYPISLGEGWILEPQAQAIMQVFDIPDFNDGAATIGYTDTGSLVGRVGFRLGRTITTEDRRQFSIWGQGNVFREFLGKPVTTFSSAGGPVPFTADLSDTWLQVGVGADVKIDENSSLFGQASYDRTFDGNSHAVEAKLGLKMHW